MKFNIEVVYATKTEQVIQSIEADGDMTVQASIDASGILHKCPEIDLSKNKVGINGVIKSLKERVYENARIEIYRPVKKQK